MTHDQFERLIAALEFIGERLTELTVAPCDFKQMLLRGEADEVPLLVLAAIDQVPSLTP